MPNLPLLKWEKLVVLEPTDFSSLVHSNSPLLGLKLQKEGRMKNKEQETMQTITQVTEHKETDIKDIEGK